MSNYLGIDIGTSALKAVLLQADGSSFEERIHYEKAFPEAYLDSFLKALQGLPLPAKRDLSAISFSGQVGTYLVNEKDVIPWSSSLGAAELPQVLSQVPPEVFLQEIGMRHPQLISYPLPRLLAFQKQGYHHEKVAFPKDYLLEQIGGGFVSDPFSWRGLANAQKLSYSTKLLKSFGLDPLLPKLVKPTDCVGYLKEDIAEKAGLSKKVKIYAGCNDFFAAILAMGIEGEGTFFDVGGTSEHYGCLTSALHEDPRLVSGPFFYRNATYGGTASSGPSLTYGTIFKAKEMTSAGIMKKNPPIFLPYLQGERCPLYDPFARGVFFGIDKDCGPEEMAYAVQEGVAFSLYSIAKIIGRKATAVLVSGGPSSMTLLNELKATLWEAPLYPLRDKEASGRGAALMAMVGEGLFPIEKIPKTLTCQHKPPSLPNPSIKEWLLQRYEIYTSLYPNVKELFKKKEVIKI